MPVSSQLAEWALGDECGLGPLGTTCWLGCQQHDKPTGTCSWHGSPLTLARRASGVQQVGPGPIGSARRTVVKKAVGRASVEREGGCLRPEHGLPTAGAAG